MKVLISLLLVTVAAATSISLLPRQLFVVSIQQCSSSLMILTFNFTSTPTNVDFYMYPGTIDDQCLTPYVSYQMLNALNYNTYATSNTIASISSGLTCSAFFSPYYKGTAYINYYLSANCSATSIYYASFPFPLILPTQL